MKLYVADCLSRCHRQLVLVLFVTAVLDISSLNIICYIHGGELTFSPSYQELPHLCTSLNKFNLFMSRFNCYSVNVHSLSPPHSFILHMHLSSLSVVLETSSGGILVCKKKKNTHAHLT